MYKGQYQLVCDCGRRYQVDVQEVPHGFVESAPSASHNTASNEIAAEMEAWASTWHDCDLPVVARQVRDWARRLRA